jgi:hypothetical protein
MGGYMGLGLQKWIYSRNPQKKPYVHEGLQSFTALPKYSRTFKLQPSIRENKRLKGFQTLIITLVFSIVLAHCYTNFINYSNKQTLALNERAYIDSQKAFNFLFNSGKNRLLDNNIKGAYSEFKLAYNIDTHNQKLNQLIIETLSILCNDNNTYCFELNDFLE